VSIISKVFKSSDGKVSPSYASLIQIMVYNYRVIALIHHYH